MRARHVRSCFRNPSRHSPMAESCTAGSRDGKVSRNLAEDVQTEVTAGNSENLHPTSCPCSEAVELSPAVPGERRCQEFCVNGFRLVDDFRLHWLHLSGG